MKSDPRFAWITALILCGFCLVFLAAIHPMKQPAAAAEISPPPASNYVLAQTGRVRMLRQNSGDPRPFFRVDFNLRDRNGNPAEYDPPRNAEELKKAIRISGDISQKLEFEPFYAAGSSGDATQAAASEMMLLVDVSGSMKASMGPDTNRLQVAKEAAQRLLQGFRPGMDRIAIVPFESRRVRERIQNADFVDSPEAAARQIESLSLGDEKGNTALYSATETAVRLLQERQKQDPSRQFLLAVLTDGDNDVHPERGDDRGLLGVEGREQLKKTINEAGIPVYTIGVGNPGGKSFNEAVLREMAADGGSYFLADTREKLNSILDILRRSLKDRLRITFYIANRRGCDRQTSIRFKVRLTAPGKGMVESGDLLWTCGMAGCAPEGDLDETERTALLRLPSRLPECNPWGILLRRLGLAALLSLGLAAFWFFVPRLMWPRPRMPVIPGRDLGARPAALPRTSSPKAGLDTGRKSKRQFEETQVYGKRGGQSDERG
jgi:Ca-activated chloride channel family protein